MKSIIPGLAVVFCLCCTAGVFIVAREYFRLHRRAIAIRDSLAWALGVIGAPTHHEDNAEGVYDACDFCMGESDRETGDMAHDDDCPWLAANLAAGDEQMEEANDV